MSEEMVYVDVLTLPLPTEGFNFMNYFRGEQDILNPALKEAGYRIISGWYTSEKDSWGVLSRATTAVDPNGKLITLFYG